MSASQTEKGREVLFSCFVDSEGAFVPMCYLTGKDFTVDSPVTGTTNQCTVGTFTDAEWTGYDTFTVNISGNADTRPESPTFHSYQSFRNEFLRGTKRKRVQIEDEFSTMESTVNITNFNETGAQEEHRTFTATLQITGDDFTIVDKVLS